MAAAPKTVLLLGILLAAFLLLSSRVADAAKELKETTGTVTSDAAAGDSVVDSKQRGMNCRNLCCSWIGPGFGARCLRCCAAGEAAPAQVAPAQQAVVLCSPKQSCCRWTRFGSLRRCIQCCPIAAKADPTQIDGVVMAEDP